MPISVAELRPNLADQSDLIWFHVDSFAALGRRSNFESVRRRILGHAPCGASLETAALGEDARIDAAIRWQTIGDVLFRLSKEDQAVLRAYYGDELTPPVLRTLASFGPRRVGVALLTSAARRAVADYELMARTAYTKDRVDCGSHPGSTRVPWCPGVGPTFGSRPPPSPSQIIDALVDLARATETKGRVRDNAHRLLTEIITEAEVMIARACSAYRYGEQAQRAEKRTEEQRKRREATAGHAARRAQLACAA